MSLVRLETKTEKEKVYDLQVDGGEFFAEGLLVSNSDSTLYSYRKCYSYLYEKPKIRTKEQIDRALEDAAWQDTVREYAPIEEYGIEETRDWLNQRGSSF